LFEGVSYPVLIAITALAAFVQGYAGFGFGIVTVAAMSFLMGDLERAAALIMLLAMGLLVVFLLGSRTRTPVQWRLVALIAPGMLIGTPLGFWFISTFGVAPVARLCLGGLLVAFAAQGFLSGRLTGKPPAVLGPPVGTAAGFFSGAYSTGGPPIVLYLYCRLPDPRQLKSTLKMLLLTLTGLRLATMLISGGAGGAGITGELLWATLWCLPAVIVALFVGHAVSRRAAAETFRKVVYALIALAGAILIVKAAMKLTA